MLIPHAATVYAMAVELTTPEPPGEFDLSCLEALRVGVYYSACRLDTVGHTKLSAPAEALHFDLYNATPLGPDGRPEEREVRLTLPVTRRGKCNAILWWFDLHLDDEITIPAGPGAQVRTWKQNVCHIHPPVRVRRGESLEALLWTTGDDQIHVAGGAPGVGRPPTADGSHAGVKLESHWSGESVNQRC